MRALATLSSEERAELVQTVIDTMFEQRTITRAIKVVGISMTYFRSLLDRDRELAASYARAREVLADVLADETIDIADTEGDSGVARNRIQVRQWAASKLAPKTYGERIDLNVAQTISVDVALTEARSRLRPMRDSVTIDADVVREESTAYIAQAPDNQSVKAAPVENPVPDIFD